MKRLVLTALLIVSSVFTFNCGKKIDPDQIVVARVGEEIITVSDFRQDYEFGLPHLKKGTDRKRSYLEFMIKEKILSLEGYRLGLHESARVKKLEHELLEELLVEELFKKEVHEKIRVTQEEIQKAITRSTVSWKLRYWVEPTLDRARQVNQLMRQMGFGAVVRNILDKNSEIGLEPKDFETDYLTWLEVPRDLLESIKDLPVGEVSNPIEMNGVFFTFQILDIRRQGLPESDLESKAERFRQILFYRKVLQEAKHYVSAFMTPKNVVTKGDAFRKLADVLADWILSDTKNQKLDFADAIKFASKKQKSLFDLRSNLRDTLVIFEGGNWTILDFLHRFDRASIKANVNDRDKIRSELNEIIALEVRNYFMLKEANRRGLGKLSSVKKELDTWRNKWIYEETRDHFLKDLHISKDQAQDYFEQFKDRYKIKYDDAPSFTQYRDQAYRDAYIQKAKAILYQKVEELRSAHPVFIYQAVLDTITTIEFKKSRWMSLQVFKKSSNRLAFPMVDPAWGL